MFRSRRLYRHHPIANRLDFNDLEKIQWINELQPGDNLDVCVVALYPHRWCVVTMISLDEAYTEEDTRDAWIGVIYERTVQELTVQYDGADASIEEQFTLNIFDKTTIKNRIAPLYTHASVHNDSIQYYNDQFKACHPHCHSRSYRRLKCIHCEIPYCRGCNVADHIFVMLKHFECRDCCIKKEYDQIFDALSFVFSDKDIDDGSDHFWVRSLITTLSIGVVAECGNFVTCSKEVYISNEYEFDGYIDYKKRKISHYAIDNVHKLRDNLKYSVIYGKYRRIFCSECTANVIQRCQHVCCDIRDIFVNNKTEIGKESYVICGDHLYCERCNFIPLTDHLLYLCIDCRVYCCDKCHLNRVCRLCLEKKEIKYFAAALREIIGDILYTNLITVVASYAIGKFMKCRNLRGCDNTICIRNESDFKANIDADRKNIYWYEARKRCKANAVCIYNKKIIIFCADCSANTLRNCCYPKCRNKEALSDVCQLHPRCYVCGEAAKSREYFYKCKANVCSNYLCDKCQITVRYAYDGYCPVCAISRESNDLFAVIKANMHMDDIICRSIANYAMGFIVKCCNQFDECTKDIFINNKYEFWTFADADNQEILHYTPNFPRDACAVMVCGKERVIFCSECTCNIKKRKQSCGWCGCIGVSLDSCQNHTNCASCNAKLHHLEKAANCKQCGNVSCKSCVYRGKCGKCFERREQIKMIKILKGCMNVINDEKIFEITASYCIGHIVSCCNEHQRCKNDVCIDNKSVLLLRKHIYQYVASKRVSKILKTVHLYGENRRVFCQKCSSGGTLTRCEYKQGNKRCGLREVAFDSSFKVAVCHKHHWDYKGHCFGCNCKLSNWQQNIYPYCTNCNRYHYDPYDSDTSNEDGMIECDNGEDKRYQHYNDMMLWNISIEKHQKTILFHRHYSGKRVSKHQKPPKRHRNRKKLRAYFKHKTDKVQNTISKQREIRKIAKHVMELEYL